MEFTNPTVKNEVINNENAKFTHLYYLPHQFDRQIILGAVHLFSGLEFLRCDTNIDNDSLFL